jgi:hypothetical protein
MTDTTQRIAPLSTLVLYLEGRDDIPNRPSIVFAAMQDLSAANERIAVLEGALRHAIDRIELYPTHDEECPVPSWDPTSLRFPICSCSHVAVVAALRAALAGEPNEPSEGET